MIDNDIIRNFLTDIESDRVERTISTTNTDKFGQAICAFANDLPNHNQPGYLIIGAEDNGTIKGVDVTDELLKNIAAIRTDGNIQPQPSMVVEKISFPEGEMIIVEVQPATFPPVKYKGRIWIRVGPRKAIANEADEKILYKKRASSIVTFDAMPCMGATIDDLDTKSFRLGYLPMAFPEDVVASDKRNVKVQLQSLGFFDTRFDCPTYAGVILFGNNVERFLPGAYIQYVRFKGLGRAGEILNEHKFSGNLYTILYQLDTFVNTTITNRRPIPISALREDTVLDYPYWATRELLMNAICHRDYESNGPVQFYQYDDRIELLNPGGLYGKARPENFPWVNDYRNSVVAEALKVMGFVNRFSRGVLRVEEELRENGNDAPEFNLNLGTAFLVTEKISHRAEEIEFKTYGGINSTDSQSLKEPDIEYGGINGGINGRIKFPTPLHKNVYSILKMHPKIKAINLADNVGVSERTVTRIIADLKTLKLITRKGGNKHGEWIVTELTGNL